MVDEHNDQMQEVWHLFARFTNTPDARLSRNGPYSLQMFSDGSGAVLNRRNEEVLAWDAWDDDDNVLTVLRQAVHERSL